MHKYLSALLILTVALLVLLPPPALAQRRTETLISSATNVFPGTPIYAPDGTATSDTAWIRNTVNDPNFVIGLYMVTDSVAGYAAADDSIAVSVIYGFGSTSTPFLPLNLTTQVLCNQQLQAAVPSDSGFWMTFTPPPHDRRRYYISSALGDTIAVSSLKEVITTASPWKIK